MFEILNNIEILTQNFITNKNLMFYINEEINKKKLKNVNILLLGKTERKLTHCIQETYVGVINDYWFFYIELEDGISESIIINKNVDLIYDLFYSRELLKNEKDIHIKEIKCMLLYKKLNMNMKKKFKEKAKKI